MGIRVYLDIPRDIISTHLRIPARKWLLVDAYRNATTDAAKEAAYSRCYNDDEAHRLICYDGDGLGRITAEAHAYAREHGMHSDAHECTGGTKDPVHIANLLALQNPEFEGLAPLVRELFWW